MACGCSAFSWCVAVRAPVSQVGHLGAGRQVESALGDEGVSYCLNLLTEHGYMARAVSWVKLLRSRQEKERPRRNLLPGLDSCESD